jgi:hypothetical protein
MSSVALWADSTYAYIVEKLIRTIAAELHFPLENFMQSDGAGLCTKGLVEGRFETAAPVVIIEMGYNDESIISTCDALVRMREQSWFTALKNQASTVKRVIFIQQPSYYQVAQQKCRKKKIYGKIIVGSRWTTEAAQLVWAELKIQTVVFDVRAEEIYDGFIRKEGDQLWQDDTRCRSYTIDHVDYSNDDRRALWYDAFHPAASGAEAHFRLLAMALKRWFGEDCSKNFVLPRNSLLEGGEKIVLFGF